MYHTLQLKDLEACPKLGNVETGLIEKILYIECLTRFYHRILHEYHGLVWWQDVIRSWRKTGEYDTKKASSSIQNSPRVR